MTALPAELAGIPVRSGLEGRLRRAWREGPGSALRLVELAYGSASTARNAAYEAGVICAPQTPIPVVSVGGLTVGGSGKTPITGELGRWLCQEGWRVAVLTHGFADEMEVHRRLNPSIVVYGGRERIRLLAEAASSGVQIALVDSGFQHRRLRRDVDIVVLDAHSLEGERACLPAGPFRERLSEAGRADVIVVASRSRSIAADGIQITELRKRFPDLEIERVHLGPGALVPANAAASRTARPEPAVAVAGVMWPELFFRQIRERLKEPPAELALPDHGRAGPALVRRIVEMAGNRGAVCTLKDAVKLESEVPRGIPLWYLSETLTWEGRPPRLKSALVRACRRLVHGRVGSARPVQAG